MIRSVIKPLAWLPVIIINAIIAWSYFAYMVIFGFGKSTIISQQSNIKLLSVDTYLATDIGSYIPLLVELLVQYAIWHTIPVKRSLNVKMTIKSFVCNQKVAMAIKC